MQWKAWLPRVTSPADLDRALVAFDSSTLLNLYQYSPPLSQRYSELITALADTKSREQYHLYAFIPPQVVYEFVSRRDSARLNAVSALRGNLERLTGVAEINLEFPVHLRSTLLADWENRVSEFLQPFVKSLEQEIQEISVRNDADPVLAALMPIFDGTGRCVPTQDEIEWLSQKGAERYRFNVPPGFKDKSKSAHPDGADNPENVHVFSDSVRFMKSHGDLLVWHQVLEKAEELKSSIQRIVLVTDEAKKDWIVEFQGRTMQHPLLTLEVFELGLELHIVNSSQFFELGSEKLGIAIDQADVQTVKSISTAQGRQRSERGATRIDEQTLAIAEVALLRHLEGQDFDVKFEHANGFDFIAFHGNKEVPVEWKFLNQPRAYHIYPIIEQIAQALDYYYGPYPMVRPRLYLLIDQDSKALAIRDGISRCRQTIGAVPVTIFLCLLNHENSLEVLEEYYFGIDAGASNTAPEVNTA